MTQTQASQANQRVKQWAVKNKVVVIRTGLEWFYIVHVISKEGQNHGLTGNLNQYSNIEGKNKTARPDRWAFPICNSQLEAARHVTTPADSRVNELLTPYLYCSPPHQYSPHHPVFKLQLYFWCRKYVRKLQKANNMYANLFKSMGNYI